MFSHHWEVYKDGESNILIIIVIMTLDAMHIYKEKQKGKVEERIDEPEISQSHPGIHSIEMVSCSVFAYERFYGA